MNRPGLRSVGLPDALAFSSHFERAAQELRGALTELFASVGIDPSVPQSVARRLGLNKNLAWKACKLVNAADVYQSVQHLPGNAGVEILLDAFSSAGAPEERLEAVRKALESFDAMVELHAGDRPTLELMLDSMLSEREPSPRLEQARKLAFQGNGAILGVRARVRAAASILAPSRLDPDYFEVTIASALVDLKRLRPSVSWPLVRFHTYVEGEEDVHPRAAPLDPSSGGPESPPFLRQFCTSPLPEIRSWPGEAGTVFELCEGPVGKTAKSTLVFGWHFPRFARWRATQEGERGEYFVRVDTPAEMLLFDLLVHRDLPLELPPEADFYSLIPGPASSPLTASARYLLPRSETVQELGSGPPVLASPHFARHPEIVRWCCERTGRSLDEFRGYRLCTSFPPLPSLAILHFPLPT